MLEIAQGQLGVRTILRNQYGVSGGVEQAGAKRTAERITDPDQYTGADDVEQRLSAEKHGGKNSKRHQGWHAAARQDTVVNLEHEDCARQHQKIDDAAEEGEPQKSGSEARKSLAHFGSGRS